MTQQSEDSVRESRADGVKADAADHGQGEPISYSYFSALLASKPSVAWAKVNYEQG